MTDKEKIIAIKEITSKEKDFYQFNYRGLTCFIIRHVGHLNGYVGLDNSNKNYNKNYRELENDIDVHGGLTYSGNLNELGYSMKDYNHLSLLGFDCGHCYDAFIYPNNIETEAMFLRGEYKDYNYVLSEVKKLADQLV